MGCMTQTLHVKKEGMAWCGSHAHRNVLHGCVKGVPPRGKGCFHCTAPLIAKSYKCSHKVGHCQLSSSDLRTPSRSGPEVVAALLSVVGQVGGR